MTVIQGVDVAALELNYQERSGELTLTTSDDGGTEPPPWANYVVIDANGRFAVAMDASTDDAVGTVGNVFGAGTWTIRIKRTEGGDGMIHLCAVSGTVSAYRSWAR